MQADQLMSSEVGKLWIDAFNTRANSIEHVKRKEEQIQLWNQHIASLTSLIALARSRRASLGPLVLALPHKALVRIFELVAQIESESESKDLSQTYIGLSHVCRTWRRVLLSSPALWIDFPTATFPLWKLCLQRSGSDPCILISLHGELRKQSRRHVQWLLKHAQLRIEIMSLAFTGGDDLKPIASTATSLPSLKRIQLLYESRPIVKNAEDVSATFYEHERSSLFFLCNHLRQILSVASNLCYLNLHGCIFPWDVTLPNLLSLRVIGPCLTQAGCYKHASILEKPFTVAQIAECLGRMPLLEELILGDFHTYSVVSTDHPPHLIQLQKLQTLNIDAAAAHSYGLLQLLCINPDAIVVITGHDLQAATPPAVEAGFSSMVACINRSGYPLTSSILINLPGRARSHNVTSSFCVSLVFHLQSRDGHARWPIHRAYFKFDFDSALADALYGWITRLPLLIKTPFSQTTSLNITDLDFMPKETWTDIFSTALCLEHLNINCVTGSAPVMHAIAIVCLLEALIPPLSIATGPPEENPSQIASLLAPKLQTLHLSHAILTYSACFPNSEARLRQPSIQDALIATLKARSECSHPLASQSRHGPGLGP